MSKANFNESRKIGVHLVSRDSAGLLQTWRENGYDMAVSRDTAGRVNYVTASGPAGTYNMGISRNSSGDYIGTTGDFLNTALLPEIISSMVGRGLSVTTTSDGRIVKILDPLEKAIGLPICVAAFSVPFVMPAGDGGATGLAFTGGGGGAFTLSSAILTDSGAILSSCFIWLAANAGGSGCAEGWYYAEFSSDTAGVIYAERYTSGVPAIPTTKTTFAGVPTGRITSPISEITGPTGFVLPGGMMGKSGYIRSTLSVMGTADAVYKNVRVRLGGSTMGLIGPSTSPIGTFDVLAQNIGGSETKQFTGRQSAFTGIVNAASSSLLNQFQSVDTRVDQPIAHTMQLSANTGAAILVAGYTAVGYGA